jgi:threonine dehydratase
MRAMLRSGEALEPLEFADIRIDEAALRIAASIRRTPLEPIERDDADDQRIELRAKLENRQETGAFKARGATNQIRGTAEPHLGGSSRGRYPGGRSLTGANPSRGPHSQGLA